MSWTEARIAQLTHLWAEGVSASGIAEALGKTSRSAVLGKLYRLQLLRSRKPAAEPRRYVPPRQSQATSSASLTSRPMLLAGPTMRRPQAPEPPRSLWNEAAFTPLAGTRPRPWLTRDFGECAFPVAGAGDGQISCCAAAKPRSAYCAAHHAVVFRPVSQSAAVAEQQRWAQAADRWAA